MEVSQIVKASQHAVASTDGRHIALINNSRLEIRCAVTIHPLRSIPLSVSNLAIRWSPVCHSSRLASRILVHNTEQVRVWDLEDQNWSATINNGSGGMGKIVSANFGGSKDEVLVFSDFGSKATIWSLDTRRTVEIRDPKFASGRGYGYRPSKSVLALLSRPAAQDILTLHTHPYCTLMKTIILPSVDAQGIKWSPDGRWIIVWETPSVGCKLFIYTADGHLYRIYTGEHNLDDFGLGIKSIDWSPRGDYLAISGHDRRVTLLSTRTFSPVMFLDHTPIVQLTAGHTVWEETVLASAPRTYTALVRPVAPPMATANTGDQAPKTGISTIAFNADGTMLATRDESTPTTVWLWDLSKLTACAALIQHSPVKQISWHPTNFALLLIQCSQDEPITYIYDAAASIPYTVPLPMPRSTSREAKWLRTAADKKPAFITSDLGGFLVAWPDGKDVILRFDDQESGAESEDSLFEILTGRSPNKLDSTQVLVSDVMEETTEIMDDTFMGRGTTSARDSRGGGGGGDSNWGSEVF